MWSARAATWRFAIAEELHQPGTGRIARARARALIRVADDGWFANRRAISPHLRAHRSLHSLGFTRAPFPGIRISGAVKPHARPR